MFLFPSSSFLIPPHFRYVSQWVRELWTQRGIPVHQPSEDSATPRLWREGAVSERHDPAVSSATLHRFAHTLSSKGGASLSALNSVHTFVCLCVCNTFCRVQCLGESCITLYGKGTNKKTKDLKLYVPGTKPFWYVNIWTAQSSCQYPLSYHLCAFFSRLALWDPAAGAVCGEAFRCCDRSAAQFLEALDLLR